MRTMVLGRLMKVRFIEIHQVFKNKKRSGTFITEQYLILKEQKGCIRGCDEFEYLGVKIDKEGRDYK